MLHAHEEEALLRPSRLLPRQQAVCGRPQGQHGQLRLRRLRRTSSVLRQRGSSSSARSAHIFRKRSLSLLASHFWHEHCVVPLRSVAAASHSSTARLVFPALVRVRRARPAAVDAGAASFAAGAAPATTTYGTQLHTGDTWTTTCAGAIDQRTNDARRNLRSRNPLMIAAKNVLRADERRSGHSSTANTCPGFLRACNVCA